MGDLTKNFKKSLARMASGDYKAAGDEFMDSRWKRQTPNRAKKVTAMIASGDWS